MATRRKLIGTLAMGCIASLALAQPESRVASAWARIGADGKLAYQTLPAGDRIMDFSSVGYMGGGVKLPRMPVEKLLKPSGGDDTLAIQAALDAVGRLPLVDGIRGAVMLEPGEFHCDATINLLVSGVALRGGGSGEDGSKIVMTGKPHIAFAIGGAGTGRPIGEPVAITDAYVPAGALSLTVANAAGFAVGDAILVNHPVTPEWVKFMGMDGLVRDGKKQTWIASGGAIRTERVITAIAGNRLTLNVPLSDSLDARWLSPPGASVVKCTLPARITQVGVSRLRIVAPPQPVTINDPHHRALVIGAVVDAWVRDVAIVDTVNSVRVAPAARRVTLDEVTITHTVATLGAAKPADFSVDGSQVLVRRCAATGDSVFFLATGAGVTGPNVLLQCTFRGNGWIQPHQRWATGLLIDNCRVPDGGIDFMNRGQMGSGHGWAIGWAVAWNCAAKELLIQRPPGAANWAIGCVGERRTDVMPFKASDPLPEGIIDSPGVPVAPASLYLAQLAERLGPQAVKNLDQ